jgi:hypothetical protein
LGSFIEPTQQKVSFAFGQKDLGVRGFDISLAIGLEGVLEGSVLEQQMTCKFMNILVIRSQSCIMRELPMKAWRSLKA